MNLIKNGSFESGQLEPWEAYPAAVTISNNAVLLPLGSHLLQVLDLDAIGDATTFTVKVRARASQEPPAEALKTKSRFQLSFYYQYGTQFIVHPIEFDASGGFQNFESSFRISLPEPLVYARIKCWVPRNSTPDYDPRDIWFTGFELLPGAHIP